MKNKILLEVVTMTNSTLSLYDAILVAIKKAWTEKNPECEIEHYNDYSRACELLTKIEFEEETSLILKSAAIASRLIAASNKASFSL